MSIMDMANSEFGQLFAKTHEQECKNVALEEIHHQLQVGFEENEKCIVGKLAILKIWLPDESEGAKNMKCNIK